MLADRGLGPVMPDTVAPTTPEMTGCAGEVFYDTEVRDINHECNIWCEGGDPEEHCEEVFLAIVDDDLVRAKQDVKLLFRSRYQLWVTRVDVPEVSVLPRLDQLESLTPLNKKEPDTVVLVYFRPLSHSSIPPRPMTTAAVLTVSCPRCKVDKGAFCTRPNGKTTGFHVPRIRNARIAVEHAARRVK